MASITSPSSERDRRRSANRENLRAHYNLQRRVSGTSSAAGSTGTRGTPEGSEIGRRGNGNGRNGLVKEVVDVSGGGLDIDSANFSPDLYFSELVTTSSLPQLMKKSTELSTDTNHLLASRHTLVYNHHHQFSNAGLTISQLNQKTPELMRMVGQLQGVVEGIQGLSHDLSARSANGNGNERDKGKRRGKEEMDRKGTGYETELIELRKMRKRLPLMIQAGDSRDKLESYLSFRKPLITRILNSNSTNNVDNVEEQEQKREARDLYVDIERLVNSIV